MNHAFGVISEKLYQTQGRLDFFLLFSVIQSVIHSELIFVKGLRCMSRTMFLHVAVQLKSCACGPVKLYL